MDLLDYFRNIGWKLRTNEDGSQSLLYTEDDVELDAIYQFSKLRSEQKCSLSVSMTSKAYSTIAGHIYGGSGDYFPLLQCYIERRAPVLGKAEIDSISAEVLGWRKEQDSDAAIKVLATQPSDTGQSQLMHISALAYLGDFNTLIDYQMTFRNGKRLNFVPMIKTEMIDRAVDVALERA